MQTTTRSPSLMEDARRLCGHPLHAMQGRLDADRKPGRSADDLPAGSRTGALGHDQLRSLRAEGGSDLAGPSGDGGAVAADFSAELGAVGAYFAARMAAARRALTTGRRRCGPSRPAERAHARHASRHRQVDDSRARCRVPSRVGKANATGGLTEAIEGLPRLNWNVSRDGWIGASTAVPRPPNRRTSAKLFLS